MEFLDVVNEKDEIVGKDSKENIYKKLLMHRIVHVFIFNKKKEIALQLRSENTPFCPHFWCTAAAGHVQSGETYEQAAIRECEEEIGLNPNLEFLSKDLYFDNFRKTGIKKFLGTFKTIHSGPFKTNPEEVEKIEFFSLKKIQEMINRNEKIHPELLFLLKKHFRITIK